jgi:hypothetical protein
MHAPPPAPALPSKAVQLREALKRTFQEQSGMQKAGLVVYGSAKPAACDDIEVMKPVAPVDPSYMKALDGIRPKGMRSVAAALDKAQTLIAPGSRNGMIVLTADGLDNCKGDPCAVARSIKERSPYLKVHVIAIDANAKRSMSALSCVAQITGGQFLPAANESEIDAALDQIASTAPAAPAAPRGAAVISPPSNAGTDTGDAGSSEPRPVPPRTGDPAPVTLTALLADGGLPVTDGIRWRIYDGSPGEGGSYKLVRIIDEGQANLTLDPGEYLVNAAYGRANLTKRLEVWPGKPVTDTFNLNAGGLRISAVQEGGQVISENQVKFEILTEAADQFGARERVVGSVRPGVVIRLNGGLYHIRSTYGDSNARIESDVAVEAGKLTEVTIKHDAGKVTFRLVRTPGGEALADTKWSIQTRDGEVVKESGGAFPAHILAAGTYKVVATHREQEYSQTFVVQSGQAQQVELVIPQ